MQASRGSKSSGCSSPHPRPSPALPWFLLLVVTVAVGGSTESPDSECGTGVNVAGSQSSSEVYSAKTQIQDLEALHLSDFGLTSKYNTRLGELLIEGWAGSAGHILVMRHSHHYCASPCACSAAAVSARHIIRILRPS
ncbi:hypothetical protein PF005_g31261 [Phytophthora fragariae]|uniref:Protein kinase domain-containing protein n=1 Tax=Phytophthora fragariae TaxID=53985 RepID=A0A6A3XGJ2_9STRA|nr:hypothetical protein PF003_g20494 [Phytophthora fragariae]KAE8928522.1 hypothetical protein PF009_g21334 [Phytophthora fragariae]KAE8985353.1 hypothetical protein PF011_g20418 [Phytophthora fragariae]KAE9063667.1 hypothetical protein PF006_g30888 [Phytophthora fragariae]KAE9079572.1 hypothetical protein PF010_g22709 [Phytophthora fragariae]